MSAEFNHSFHHRLACDGGSFLPDGFVADLLHFLAFDVHDAVDSSLERGVFIVCHTVGVKAMPTCWLTGEA